MRELTLTCPREWTPQGPVPNGPVPFAFKFDKGFETFSFLVGGFRNTNTFRDVQSDKDRFIYWACNIIGRGFDIPRCTAIAARTTPDGDVEVRLSFSPPWWYLAMKIASGETSA